MGERYKAVQRHCGEWIILDLWSAEGAFSAGFKNGAEAVAQARKLNEVWAMTMKPKLRPPDHETRQRLLATLLANRDVMAILTNFVEKHPRPASTS